MLHLILEDLTFNDKLKTFFNEQGFAPEDGKVYQTMGIIGCQSSGKSTLLNHIFNTKFEIMSEEKGRTQTTKGIWIAINKEFKTILFDVEGTDSKERGDERFKFEQCSSLFTLAMSDVLMINMWTSDIGRYTASNYGVLKVVFEQNLKLCQQESEKKIIVVLRDFNAEIDDISKIKELIMNDMRQIWEEIPKPDAFKGKPCEQFFKFEFLTLAHKFYQESKFLQDVENIKKRLVRTKDDYKTGANQDSLFNLVNYDKNVPIDGFYKYSSDMWNNILNNKDLNIPGQKEMLARFKCDEIKLMAINGVEAEINDLEIISATKNMTDFKDRINSILNEALKNYDLIAKNYLPHIYQDVRKTLISELANKMYTSFANQLKRLIPKYQKDFRNEFEQKLKNNDNFYEVSEELKKKYLIIFEEQIKNLCVFDTWESGKDNAALLDEIIENQKSKCLEEKREKLLEKFEDIVEDTITNKFELITPNFWEEYEQEIFQTISENLLAQKEYLISVYRIKEEDTKPFMLDCENEVQRMTKTKFLKQLPNFPVIQVENFKKDFWYDDGIPRVWNKLSTNEIDELYEKNCNKYKNTFELLKELKVLPHLLEFCNYQKLAPEEMETIINSKIGEKLNDPNTKYEQLIDDKTLQNSLTKYEDGTKEIYEDAKRRHETTKSTVIPIWAWILLVYVGYKDVWKMFTGYWLILLIVFGGFYSILRAIGLGNAPIMAFNMLQTQIKNIINGRK